MTLKIMLTFMAKHNDRLSAVLRSYTVMLKVNPLYIKHKS